VEIALVILQGISRGAVVAGLVAAKRKQIRGLILISGVYDFIDYQEHATTNNDKKSIMKAIQAEGGKH